MKKIINNKKIQSDYYFLLTNEQSQNQRCGCGGHVGPKTKGGGGIVGIVVGDHLVHGTGRDERAETQVNHDPGTGRLHQRG